MHGPTEKTASCYSANVACINVGKLTQRLLCRGTITDFSAVSVSEHATVRFHEVQIFCIAPRLELPFIFVS
jgi:hypothetical protein